MKFAVYKATVIDKDAGAEPISYESSVAVCNPTSRADEMLRKIGLTDEDIHYYFSEDEWAENLQDDGTIETEEFTYWVGEEIK